jgi:hypothetical protein
MQASEYYVKMYVFSSSEWLYRYWFRSIKRVMDGSYAKSKNDIIRLDQSIFAHKINSHEKKQNTLIDGD